MNTDESFYGLSMPASLLLARRPRFAVYDQFGIPLDIDHGLDPQIDPVVFVQPRDAIALMRWGEEHAASILFDDSIALWERQFFLQRGLMLQSLRLFRHRARFKRLHPLTEVIRTVAAFLAQEPTTYAAALSMTPHRYSPAAHAVGTGLLASALVAGTSDDGTVNPETLMAPLLAGIVADVGLVDSHRDLLSFERPMTPPERAVLRAHPQASRRLIRGFGIGSERLLSAVEHHHERIDGSGYPLALGGDAVPRLAQVVGLADAFMTLVTGRPRFTALEPAAAIEVVATDAFDAQLVATLAEDLNIGEHAPSSEAAA